MHKKQSRFDSKPVGADDLNNGTTNGGGGDTIIFRDLSSFFQNPLDIFEKRRDPGYVNLLHMQGGSVRVWITCETFLQINDLTTREFRAARNFTRIQSRNKSKYR